MQARRLCRGGQKFRSGKVPEILDLLPNRISARAKVTLTAEIAGGTNRSIAAGINPFIRDLKVLPAFQDLQEEGVIPIVPIVPIGIGMTATRNHLERVRILSLHDRKVLLASQRSLAPEAIPIPIPIAIGTGAIPNKDLSGKQRQNHSFNPG